MSRRRWRAFAALFDDSRRVLVASLFVSIAQALVLLPVALIVKRIFDTYVPHGDTGPIVLSGIVVLALYLVSAGLGLLTAYMVLRATKRAITRLRGELIERVVAFPRAWFDRTKLGELQSTIVMDSERVDAMANVLVGTILPAATVAVGLSAILIVLNPLLFAVLVTVVPLLIFFGKVLGRSVRGRMRRLQRAWDAFSSGTQMTLRAITLVKVQGAERTEVEARRADHVQLGRAGLDLAWVRGAYGIVQSAIAASSGVIVLVFGGVAAARHDMTIGELLSFYAVLALLLRQVNAILGGVPQVLSGYESVSRLDDLLEAEDEEPYRGSRVVDRPGTIELRGVTFGYGDTPLLRDVDLTIAPGERVAIFGPNGAGKSTLLNLLLGLYRPDKGRLLAGGIPYDELDVSALRRRMGVVLQDPVVFPGSIAENIAYGHPGASPAEVRRAAEWATAASFIEDLPDGYETDAGDEGALISGGQRQRIAIARALVAAPSLLVLDEPTTHLDDASIAALMENLCNFPGAPAVLMISHDPEVARNVDTVHHLRDGQIVRTELTDRPRLATV